MKRKILSLLIIMHGLFLFSGCQHPEGKIEWPEENLQWLSYAETQCADPWGYGNSQQDKAQYVKGYLEKQGIQVFNISLIKESEGAMCLACTCPSGRVLRVQVKKEDEAKLLALGFKMI
ncbi:hypothetical protein GU926_13000 [Nibribacter ruber]|uniref:Uncharacterized protein n=1 Tax=Nibribacter ruber TaxID=2698458 RepID=A0A6P1P0R2_9BACT|nr:hypothetical protein [Nibribacter ruber]QHL88299.1 hypothetical protein GU926_13000 [Nibribacter ruber]